MHSAAALGPDGADRAQLQILCFSHMEVWWGLCLSSKSIGIIFPAAFAHHVPLCHILAIFAIVQTSLLLL